VKIRGAGVGERYYAVDTCPAEVGGRHEWPWFHFDERAGALDEMKISQGTDMSLCLTEDDRYLKADGAPRI